jgi:hypothetical protein
VTETGGVGGRVFVDVYNLAVLVDKDGSVLEDLEMVAGGSVHESAGEDCTTAHGGGYCT